MSNAEKKHQSCTVVRTVLIQHHTFSLTTGETKSTGKEEWRTGPCDVPLFSDTERATGICKGCAGGWNHPNNYRADGPRPTAESN